jgi:hypothetical protein
MRRMKKLIIIALVAVLPACKSSNASTTGEPCDTAAPALLKQLHAHDKALVGKQIGLKNCKFSSQGNDSVYITSFTDSSEDLDCHMAGGEAGNKKFRHAAMEFDMKKLKLDVTAKIAELDGRLELTECNITPHE